jgi:hypothetical protein
MGARSDKALNDRAIVRAVMLEIRRCWPLAPLTKKSIAPRLPFPMSRSTLYRHMAAIIRAEGNNVPTPLLTEQREFVSLSQKASEASSPNTATLCRGPSGD